MTDPENGLVVVKESPYLEFELQYLPAAYLGWREVNRAGRELSLSEQDSVLAQFDDEVHFQLTIRPREGRAEGDVAFGGVRSETDFDARVRQLNFELGQYFELRVGEERLRPVLAHFENIYGLTEFRRVEVVFPRPEGEGDWAVVFEDGVWGSGVWWFGILAEDSEK